MSYVNALRKFREPLTKGEPISDKQWKELKSRPRGRITKTPKPYSYMRNMALLGQYQTKANTMKQIQDSAPENHPIRGSRATRATMNTEESRRFKQTSADGVPYVNKDIFELTKKMHELMFA